jgi:hypothetical protein
MHRLEQTNPHHLRDPARIVAICLVDLLRRQQSLHVPRLDADQDVDAARDLLPHDLGDRLAKPLVERRRVIGLAIGKTFGKVGSPTALLANSYSVRLTNRKI